MPKPIKHDAANGFGARLAALRKQAGITLQQIATLPPDERRQIMQLVDAFIERGQLKRRSSSPATSG